MPNSNPTTPVAPDFSVMLAQATTTQTQGAASPSLNTASEVAQAALTEALNSGIGNEAAVAQAVEVARQLALSRGLTTQQADVLVSQIQIELAARISNGAVTPAIEGTQGSSVNAPRSAAGREAALSAVDPLAPVNPLSAPATKSPAATVPSLPQITSTQATPVTENLAQGPSMVDSGGGMGSSSLGSFSRSISSQVGVDAGGSINVTGMIAPYLTQQVSPTGGLVSAMAEQVDIRGSSSRGGDPASITAAVNQIASIKTSGNQVGSGAVSLPVIEDKPVLEKSAGPSASQSAPIRLPPFLDIESLEPTVSEGHEGFTEIRFKVTRTGDLSEVDRVKWTATGLNEADMALASALTGGELVFQPMVDSLEIVLRVAANRWVEGNRDLKITIQDPVNARLGPVTEAQTTILNDDSQYDVVRAEDQLGQVLETTNDTDVPVVFKVTRTGNLDQPSWVKYSAGVSSDLDGADFSPATMPQGTVSFAAGQSVSLVTLLIHPDQVIEGNEKLVLTLTESDYPALITTPAATVTIENDDVRFDVARDTTQAPQVLEGTFNGSAPVVVFKVTKDGTVSTDRTVTFTASGLSAEDFQDGQIPQVTLTFTANQTEQWVTLRLKEDAVIEADETLVVSLSNESHGSTVGTRTATLKVENDDVRFDVALETNQAPQVLEGTFNGSAPVVVFKVTKDGTVSTDRTVTFTASGLSADDFENGQIPQVTLTFAANQTEQWVTLRLKEDAVVEADETLVVSLSNESHGSTVGTRTATLMLENDDVSWAITRAAASVIEGTSLNGLTPVVFTVTKTGTVGTPRTVDYAVTGVSGSDIDGGQLPAGTLTFGANESSRQITFFVNQDAQTGEGDELLIATLSAASAGATITQPTASTLIYNDDFSVSVSAVETTVRETDSGQETLMVFRVSRTEGLDARSVNWALDLSGISPADLVNGPQQGSGSVDFLPGQTEAFITVRLHGNDSVNHSLAPQATLTLSSPTNGLQLGTQSTQTITVADNDVYFSIDANQTSVTEGYAGESSHQVMVFTVTRDTATPGTDTVQWRVSPSSDANAVDFTSGQEGWSNAGLPSGSVTFTGSATSETVTLVLAGDDWYGANENVKVSLSNPSRGSILKLSDDSLISNDDAPYSVMVHGSNQQLEGNDTASAAQFVFSITRPADSALDERILLWSVKGAGTLDPAASADDFSSGATLLPSGLVTFAAAATQAWVTITVTPDNRMEGHESFVLAIADSAETQNTTITVPLSAPVHILDDDAAYRIDAKDAIWLEGSALDARQAFVFEVTREGYVDLPATLDWTVTTAAGNDTVNASDFSPNQNNATGLPAGQVTFAAGASSASLTVWVAADANYEPNEPFLVRIGATNEAGMSFTQRSAAGLVLNDEIGLELSAVSTVLPEGDTTPSELVFLVRRLGVTQSASTVEWRVVTSDSGLTPDDFVSGQNGLSDSPLPGGSLSFTAGEASRLITVQVAHDVALESHEQFALELSNASLGSQILTATANATIVNDDAEIQMDPLTVLTVDEGNGGSQPFVIRVVREGSTVGTDMVAWSLTTTGTHAASLTDDLSSASSGVLTFANGSADALLTVMFTADSVEEDNETFTLSLGATSTGASLKTGGLVTREFTITNDDSTVTINPVVASVNEGGDEQGGALVYEIVRTGALRAGTVSYGVISGTAPAASGSDFATTPAFPADTLSFTDGQASYRLTLNIQGDYANEQDEHLSVTLTSVSAGQTLGTQSTLTGLIVNDDTGLSVTANTAEQTEGSTANGLVAHEFTITRSGILTGTTTVNYNVTGFGTTAYAADELDFKDGQLPSGLVTFAPNDITQVVTIWTRQDQSVENNEGIRLTLSDASGNADIQQATADTTLLSDDSGLTIAAQLANLNEGSQGNQQVLFNVTRTGDLAKVSTVNWALDLTGNLQTDDLAAGAAVTGALTFAAGITLLQISIPLKGDRALEADETMLVTLSGANAGSFILSGQDAASTRINNDDDLFTLVANTASATEGATGVTKPLTFTISRDSAGILRDGTTVEWTLNSSMLKPNDFDLIEGASQDLLGSNGGLPSGIVTFSGTQISRDVTVWVHGDGAVERDETYSISVLTSADNTAFVNTSVTGAVVNDDFGFSVEAVDPSVIEGQVIANGAATGSGRDLVFSITRAGASSDVATVKYALSGSAGLIADDLVGGFSTLTEVTFTSGELIKTITVQARGDTTLEGDEQLVMTLSNARSVTQNTAVNIVDAAGNVAVTATATLTVLNDDMQFDARVSGTGTSATVQEGGAFSTTPLLFEVVRTGDTSVAATVQYVVAGGTGVTTADYVGTLPSGSLSFVAGQASQIITIMVNGDHLGEASEPYTLTLSSPTLGIIGNTSATIIVANDDTNYLLSPLNDVTEGTASGANNYTFTIQRVGNLSVAGSVQWAASARSGDDLTAGDFVAASALPSGTANFAINQSTAVVTLAISRDSTLEVDEGMVITLTNPNQGSLETDTLTQATAVIQSDDDVFAIGLATGQSAEFFEGNTGSQNVVFTVTRTGALRDARTLSYAVAGIGINANDFEGTPLTASLTFAAGETSQNITLALKGESNLEDQETLTVTLSATSGGATLNTAATQAQVIVNNDDAQLSISAQNPSINEASTVDGVVQQRAVVFTISRTGYEFQNSTFSYSAAGVTADDFYANALPSGTLTFTNGETTLKNLTLVLKADSVKELDENLLLSLINPSVGTEISTTAGTATQAILNDDSEFNITAGTASRAEGDAGHSTAAPFTYTVTRTGSINSAASVEWYVEGTGGAGNFNDFSTGTAYYVDQNNQPIRPQGTLNFVSGQTSATVTFFAYGDSGSGSIEGNENFVLGLRNAPDSSSVGATGTYTSTILDDDTLITATSSISQAEEVAGQTTLYFYTLTRSGYVDRVSTVSYAVSGQTKGTESAADTADFVGNAFPSGNVTFTAGETVKTITVQVQGDDTVEADQWFKIDLTGTSGVDQIKNSDDVNTAVLLGEIKQDEAKFSIVDTATTGDSVYEGDSGVDGSVSTATNLAMAGNQRAHTFQVNRELSLNGSAWVNWAVGGGLTGYDPADATDFVGDQYPSGQVTFVEGQSEGFITIWTKADDVGEFEEDFRVYITAVSSGSSFRTEDNASYNENRVVLKNDDTRFDITQGATVTEGASFVLTITRAGDARGSDIAQWVVGFSGTETSNETSGTTTTWYKLDPADVGANATAIAAAVTAEGMSVNYNDAAKQLSGEILFLNGETTKTITISTIDDNLTETWRELLPTSIVSTNTRNVTGSLLKLSGTFADGDVVSVNIDGNAVSYSVTAANVSTGGGTATTYSNILSGLTSAINANGTVAAVATAKTYTLSNGPGLLIEDDTPFATGSFIVTTSATGTGTATVVAEVAADRETASPGYTGSQWVLDNEPDLVTVTQNVDYRYENTNTSDQTVVFTLTRNNNAATGDLLYPTTIAWRVDGTAVLADVSSIAGTGSVITYENAGPSYSNKPASSYSANSIFGLTSFTSGQTTALVTLTIQADLAIENDENIAFRLVDAQTAYNYLITEHTYTADADGYKRYDSTSYVPAWGVNRDNFGPANVDMTSANSNTTFTIRDDDIRIYFATDENNIFSEFESNTSPVITLTREGVLDTSVVLDYSVQTVGPAGSTTVNADFGTRTGRLTMAAQTDQNGTAIYTFTLANLLNDDESIEGTEWFNLNLTAPADVEGQHVRFYNHSGAAAAVEGNVNGRIYDNETNFTWSWVTDPILVNEGNDGSGQYTNFVASLNRSTGYMGVATVAWSLAPGYSVLASDFYGDTLPSGTLTFGNGVTRQNVTLKVRQDLVVESNETFALRLTGVTVTENLLSATKSYAIDSSSATVTNDDTGLTINNASTTEVDEGANSAAVFTITRTGSINETSAVTWQVTTTGGAGNAGTTDFDATTGTVNFIANQATATVTVLVKGDNDAESDELFRLQITGATNVEDTSYQSNPGTGTIRNDDSAFSIVANQAQGALESEAHTFTITRTHSTAQDQVVKWQIEAPTTGDFVNATDFTGGLTFGYVTFVAGSLSATVTVPVRNDDTFEFNETYTVALSLTSGADNDVVSIASAQGKILNDDTAFNVTVNQSSRPEDAGAVVFTVTRVGELSAVTTVQFALSSPSGFNSSDYSGSLPANQTLTFGATIATQTFTIDINSDSTFEADESIIATLSNPSGAVLASGQSTATATLTNDDARFALSWQSGSLDADEGNGAARDVVFRVTRTDFLDSSGTVSYSVTPSDTSAQADFTSPLTANLFFSASQTTQDFTLSVSGDLIAESEESFAVALSTASTGFTVAGSAQTIVLRNDDTRFDLTATGSTTVTEADDPTAVPMEFQIARTGRTSAEQVVQWTVEGLGADAATADDFIATTGFVTFAANNTSPRLFTVMVKGDLEGEANETFKVSISGDGLQFGDASVTTGLIMDDEASLSIRRHIQGGAPIDDAYEGQTGEIAVVYDVLRAGNIASTSSTVDWSVNAAGGINASDFSSIYIGAMPSGSLTFAPTITLLTVTVIVKGDSTIELDENLIVTLTNPSSDADVVDAKSAATVTVLSDDTLWTLESVSTPSVESDTASDHVYRVVRTGGLYATSIDYAVAGAGSTHAADAADFAASTFLGGSVAFSAGQTTSALFTVQVTGDSVLEANEQFSVTLGTPVSDGTPRVNDFTVASLTATIINDDDVIGVSALSTQVHEADTDTPVTFTLTRRGELSGQSTMGWRVVDSSTDGKSNANDFVVPTGTVTFGDGISELTLTLLVKGDTDVEPDENFTLELHTPGAGSTVETGTLASATGQILNDDIDLRITASVGEANEGDLTPGVMTFLVTRSGLLTGSTTVDFVVTDVGIAPTNDADFAASSPRTGSVSFAANESRAWITITASADGDFEASESYQVLLRNASGNAQIETAAVTGVIRNDDDQLEVVPYLANQAEGTQTSPSLYTDFVFEVNRTGSAIGDASATWTVTAGSGRALTIGAEVQASTGTVTFTDTQSTAYITVGVLADERGEYDESFKLALSNPSLGSTLIGVAAQGTVINDDPVLSITANQATQAEGNTDAADSAFVFTVTRTGNTSGASTAKWQVAGVNSGESVDPIDFGGYLPSGMVVFTAGQVTETLTVMVLADQLGEFDENLMVTLSDPTGADLLDERIATMQIINDDTMVSIQGLASSVAEGAEGSTTPAYFVVTRDGNTAIASSIQWRVEGLTTAQVIAEDFVSGQDGLSNGGLPSGSVSFTAGQATATIAIQIDGDAQYATDEVFRVALSQPSLGGVRGNPATFTVVNDDAQISLQTAGQIGAEGSSLTYTLTRAGTGLALSSEVVVRWAVAGTGENALVAADLASMTGLVTFAANSTSASVTLQVLADELVERDEGFRLELTQVTSGNASLNPTAFVAEGAITDEDVGVWLTATESQVLEGSLASGQTPFVVTVHRTGRLDQPTVVNLLVSGQGSAATAPADFTATNLSVTFAANDASSQLVTLSIVNDALGEADENFVISIDPTAGYTIMGGAIKGTVLNDDGTSGADVIHGTSANEVLSGGAGNDVLFGGGGVDRFVLDAPSYGVDTIMDFGASDFVVYQSSAFANLNISSMANVSGTLDQILASLSSGANSGDADFLRINVNGEFQFAAGSPGHLDELEAAITQGNAVGAGFVAVSDGTGPVHLYFDSNLASGTDGTGLEEIAVLHSLASVHQVQLVAGS